MISALDKLRLSGFGKIPGGGIIRRGGHRNKRDCDECREVATCNDCKTAGLCKSDDCKSGRFSVFAGAGTDRHNFTWSKTPFRAFSPFTGFGFTFDWNTFANSAFDFAKTWRVTSAQNQLALAQLQADQARANYLASQGGLGGGDNTILIFGAIAAVVVVLAMRK